MKLLINAKKDINITAQNGVELKANLALHVKSGAKDQKIEAGANFSTTSMMDTSIATKDKLGLNGSSMINFNSLMELTLVADGGDVNAKGGMIHMN